MDKWFYPREIEGDLSGCGLSEETTAEALACAWEYARCVIPQFTNWARYIAFTRTIAIGIVVEFRGRLADMAADDNPLGYDLDELLGTLFAGTPGHEAMVREYRAFLLITADKSSERRNSELFRRYVNALTRSPQNWFRMRDCDALARYTMAAALACNDLCDTWFSESEFQILAELCDTLYDAVAYYKHRAEGETNSTFAYVGHDLRTECYRRYREVLWDLDTAWAHTPAHRPVANFIRSFGGPIHMMMRRYRFVEDDLMVGRPETDHLVTQTRQNVKLWHRVDPLKTGNDQGRYRNVLARSDELMFPSLADMLRDNGYCDTCRYRLRYGAESAGRFGGVDLCGSCRAEWQAYLRDFPARAHKVFPALSSA
jgi:hypothetical protein